MTRPVAPCEGRKSTAWAVCIASLSAFLMVACTVADRQAAAGAALCGDGTRLPTIDLREVWRSSPDSLFSDITSLDVDAAGRVYVADRLASRVAVLSQAGAVIRFLGRPGRGPGEFVELRGVQLLPRDSVQAYDAGLGRITVFVPNTARLAYTSAVPPSLGLFPYMVIRARTRPLLLAAYRRPYTTSDDPREDSTRTDVLRLITLTGSLVKDSVTVFPGPVFIVSRVDGAVYVRPDPFDRHGIFALSPSDDIYSGWTESLFVQIRGLQGDRRRAFRASYLPPPVVPADFGRLVSDTDPRLAETLRRAAPARWPAFKGLTVDDAGRAWITLVTGTGQLPPVAVFDSLGAPSGCAAVEPGAVLHLVRGDMAYGLGKDASDVPHVVAYRIRARSPED